MPTRKGKAKVVSSASKEPRKWGQLASTRDIGKAAKSIAEFYPECEKAAATLLLRKGEASGDEAKTLEEMYGLRKQLCAWSKLNYEKLQSNLTTVLLGAESASDSGSGVDHHSILYPHNSAGETSMCAQGWICPPFGSNLRTLQVQFVKGSWPSITRYWDVEGLKHQIFRVSFETEKLIKKGISPYSGRILECDFNMIRKTLCAEESDADCFSRRSVLWLCWAKSCALSDRGGVDGALDKLDAGVEEAIRSHNAWIQNTLEAYIQTNKISDDLLARSQAAEQSSRTQPDEQFSWLQPDVNKFSELKAILAETDRGWEDHKEALRAVTSHLQFWTEDEEFEIDPEVWKAIDEKWSFPRLLKLLSQTLDSLFPDSCGPKLFRSDQSKSSTR